jgi:hypothetical protein
MTSPLVAAMATRPAAPNTRTAAGEVRCCGARCHPATDFHQRQYDGMGDGPEHEHAAPRRAPCAEPPNEPTFPWLCLRLSPDDALASVVCGIRRGKRVCVWDPDLASPPRGASEWGRLLGGKRGPSSRFFGRAGPPEPRSCPHLRAAKSSESGTHRARKAARWRADGGAEPRTHVGPGQQLGLWSGRCSLAVSP